MNRPQPIEPDNIVDAIQSWGQQSKLPCRSDLKTSVRRKLQTTTSAQPSYPALALSVGFVALGLSLGVWWITRHSGISHSSNQDMTNQHSSVEPEALEPSNASNGTLAIQETEVPSREINSESRRSFEDLIAQADLLSQRIEALQLQTYIASVELTLDQSLAQSEHRLAKDRVIADWYASNRSKPSLEPQ
jgi:hypothetical protein